MIPYDNKKTYNISRVLSLYCAYRRLRKKLLIEHSEYLDESDDDDNDSVIYYYDTLTFKFKRMYIC